MNNYNSHYSRYISRQNKTKKIISIFESFLRAILCLIIIASLLLTFISAIVKYRIYDTSGIINAILTPEYYSLVNDQVEEAIEDSCLQLDYDKDKAMALVDETQVNYMTGKYISSMVNRVLIGSSEELPSYPSDAFEKAFDELFDAHEAETGEVIDEDTRNYYVDLFVRSIEHAIYLTGNSKTVNELLGSVNKKVTGILGIFDNFGLFLTITLVMLFIYYISLKRSVLTKVYRLTSIIWLGTSLIFIPSIMVFIYDLPSRIPLLDSPIKSIIVSMIEYFVNFMLLSSSIVWSIATVMLISCIILLVKRPYKHHRHKHRRNNYDFDHYDDDYDDFEPIKIEGIDTGDTSQPTQPTQPTDTSDESHTS